MNCLKSCFKTSTFKWLFIFQQFLSLRPSTATKARGLLASTTFKAPPVQPASWCAKTPPTVRLGWVEILIRSFIEINRPKELTTYIIHTNRHTTSVRKDENGCTSIPTLLGLSQSTKFAKITLIPKWGYLLWRTTV